MNYHQSLMNFCHHFFLPVCECLGTFSRFLVCQVFFLTFYSFSEAKRFFIISSFNHEIHEKARMFSVTPPFL